MNTYKVIPSFPQFELCDTVPMEYAVRNIQTKEYCHTYMGTSGYPKVYFLIKYTGSKSKSEQYLHSLVCEVFYGKRPKGMQIDHLNTCKLDFRHENLHYVTQKENMNNPLTRKHKSECQKKRFQKPSEKLKQSKNQKKRFENPSERFKHAKPVYQIDIKTQQIIKKFEGLIEAERQLHIARQSIRKVCNGKLKSAGGYFWKWATE